MHSIPKTISAKARDRLVMDLASRGINYDELPDELFHYRMRDILEWLKSNHGLTYCYRCQRLTYPDEMIGRTNMCNKHTNRNTNSLAHRFTPHLSNDTDPTTMQRLSDTLQAKIEANTTEGDIARLNSELITERFVARQTSSDDLAFDVLKKARKE